jgi:predicted transcriptional regulator
VTHVTDDRTVSQTMTDLGITTGDIARRSGVDPSYASKQLRGRLHLQRCVKKALVEALDERAIAALPHVASLLKREGENDAADACEGLWERLRRTDDEPAG